MSSYHSRISSGEFTAFVLAQTKKAGWQGRVSQRWDREMADLIEYQKKSQGELDDKTARNYVYQLRTQVREALTDLPDKDKRKDLIEDLEVRLKTPSAFMAGGLRLNLAVMLSEFSEFAVSQAVRGWKNWKEEVATRWTLEQAHFKDKTDASKKNYISRYRKAVRERLKEESAGYQALETPLMSIVCHDKELTKRVNEEYNSGVRTQMRSLVVIHDWELLVREFQKLLDSEDPYLLLIGLMGVTGRRMYELSTTAKFAPVYEMWGTSRIRHKYVLNFSGQIKTKGAKGTKHDQTYRIPCLAPASMVLHALHTLRNTGDGKMWKEMTNPEFNSATTRKMAQKIRNYPGIAMHWPKQDNYTASSLRALYAEICYNVFAPSTIAKSPYFAQILGHSEDDMETSLSYMDYALSLDDQEAARADMQRLINQMDKDFKKRGKAIPEPRPEPTEEAKADADFQVIESDQKE